MEGLYYWKRREVFLRMRQNMKMNILGLALIVLQWSVCAGAQAEDVEYYAVLMEGAKIGYATHSRIVAEGPDSGLASRGGQVTTTETTALTINR
jgi:hypothetical protein